jgi:hypothetical protein
MRLKHTYLYKAHSVGSQINQVKFRLQVTGDSLQVAEDNGQASGDSLPFGLVLCVKFSRVLKVDIYPTLDHFFPVGAIAQPYPKTVPCNLSPVSCPLVRSHHQ